MRTFSFKDVDDQRQSFTAANMHMTSVKLHGTSQFRIKYITTDIKGMKATCGIHFDLLKVTGNYVLSSFMTKSKGSEVLCFRVAQPTFSPFRRSFRDQTNGSRHWWNCNNRSRTRWQAESARRCNRHQVWWLENGLPESWLSQLSFQEHSTLCESFGESSFCFRFRS